MSASRSVALAPEPLVLARALAARPGLAVLASRPEAAPRPSDARVSFVACDPVEESHARVPAEPRSGEEGDAPLWIGVIPYEALRSAERPAWTLAPDPRPPCAFARPRWRRYAAVVRVDHTTGGVSIVGDDEPSVARLVSTLEEGLGRTAPVASLGLRAHAEAGGAHLARIREALRLIATGDVYEINLARRIEVAFPGDAIGLLERLLDAAPAPWGFLQELGDTLVAASSPELALSVRGDALRTCPIKGTRPRGRDDAEDAALARELEADPKERAELTMAIDVHRSDLGRVAVPGSVEVHGAPRVLGGKTVWSRVAEITAVRSPGVTLDEIVAAVLPCGSVTGAPKVRAMEIIAHLEPWRRGLYTGAFGFVGRDGRLELAVAIRTLQIDRESGRGDYFAGGGIVADSVPERELEETEWKAVQLGQL